MKLKFVVFLFGLKADKPVILCVAESLSEFLSRMRKLSLFETNKSTNLLTERMMSDVERLVNNISSIITDIDTFKLLCLITLFTGAGDTMPTIARLRNRYDLDNPVLPTFTFKHCSVLKKTYLCLSQLYIYFVLQNKPYLTCILYFSELDNALYSNPDFTHFNNSSDFNSLSI